MTAALAQFSIPGIEHISVLGALERNVSIQLQQVRALNLIWLLQQQRRLVAGTHVLVVGGGFAGLTAAAAASRLGARVTLLERAKSLLGLQRNNRVRVIYPFIHEWPHPTSKDGHAALPVLDWHASLAGDMASEVLAGFERECAHGRIELRLGSAPLDEKDLSAAAQRGEVILALGLGVERSFGALPLGSYWLDETIRLPTFADRRARHLVSGLGEGGVIDTMTLALAEFSHGGLAAAIDAIDGMSAVHQALLDIDGQVDLTAADTEDGNRALTTAYAALPVPRGVDDWLLAHRRPDTDVTLNGPEPDALSAKADRLNRFVTSRLLATGIVAYHPGTISKLTGDDQNGYSVTFGDETQLACDRIHIRHGAVPALRAAFPSLWAVYEPHRMRLPFDVPVRQWPNGAFD